MYVGQPVWSAPMTASSSPANTDESVMARLIEVDVTFLNMGGNSKSNALTNSFL